jgi:hypothetical protein
VISSLSDSSGRRPRPLRGDTTQSSTKTYSAVRRVFSSLLTHRY